MEDWLIWGIVAVVGVVFFLLKGASSQNEVNSEAETLEKEVKSKTKRLAR